MCCSSRGEHVAVVSRRCRSPHIDLKRTDLTNFKVPRSVLFDDRGLLYHRVTVASYQWRQGIGKHQDEELDTWCRPCAPNNAADTDKDFFN
jgi:hypothetical protein